MQSRAIKRFMAMAAKAKVHPQQSSEMPMKKSFSKRKKDSGQQVINPVSSKEALTNALFSCDKEKRKHEQDVLDERAFIEKSWSRLQMMRQHARSEWESNFMKSKLVAINELEKVSGELARFAKQVDYAAAPVHRRLPSETLPTKYPWTMSNK